MSETIYYNLLMWVPFYFSMRGYMFNASLISIMFPIFMAVGAILFEQFRCCGSKNKYVITIFYFLIIVICLFLGLQSDSPIPLYMVLIGLIGFLLSPGETKTLSSDPPLLTKENERLNYLIVQLFMLLSHFLMLVLMVLVGWTMEKGTNLW